MRNRLFWILPFLVLLLLSGCSGQERVTLRLREYAFDPASITVSQGREVQLTLYSEDTEHGFTAPELGIPPTRVPAGDKATVQFVPRKPGLYTGYCTVEKPGHENMRLTIEVK